MSALDPNSDNSVVEQALRDGVHKALLDHLEAGIYLVDRGRRILYWNRGADPLDPLPGLRLFPQQADGASAVDQGVRLRPTKDDEDAEWDNS